MTTSSIVHLVLVGGLAGCGKTTVAYELCRKTQFGYFDKDTLTGRMIDMLLLARGGPEGRDERDSDYYTNEVRPLEYECLMNSVFENISLGNSTVATAPFMREFTDAEWRMHVKHSCETVSAKTVRIHYVWVHATDEVMKRRLINRRAARDRHKLANWDTWLASARVVRPAQPCFELNCSADHESEYRAMEIIDRFSLLGYVRTNQ